MNSLAIPGSKGKLKVRDLVSTDLPFIIDYWTKADPAFLFRMGVAPHRVPNAEEWRVSLLENAATPDPKKTFCPMVWDVDGSPVGYSTLKRIRHGLEGEIHLHMWQVDARKRGFGIFLFAYTAIHFFDRFGLQLIACEPSPGNPAPNRLLQKLGFQPVKTYRTVPSELCDEVEVNRYELRREPLIRACEKIGSGFAI